MILYDCYSVLNLRMINTIKEEVSCSTVIAIARKKRKSIFSYSASLYVIRFDYAMWSPH